ncbi:hypothetical protein Bhyg_07796 [Pseudolycoriella hygida]|uniref:Uncharacterized protein n=1 Tax=Pseudolycoriella hygida TaxID=35572 RepID=A0A9Q0N475_9DIPT|nr:hypothetical protein Bhyg_07796 [Pseudolycoriella hygida]
MSIKTINEKDIASFQNYLKSEGMKDRVPPESKKEDYYGVFWQIPEKAYILPGHVKFLEQIVDQDSYQKCIASSADSGRNPILDESTIASTSRESIDVSIVELVSNELLNPIENNEAEIRQQNMSQTESQPQLERLLKQIVSWMRKNHKAVYEQRVPFPYVLGNGKRSNFYSSSNFHRHLVRHTQTNKSERVTRSSKSVGSKRKLTNKCAQSGKRKIRNDTSSASEDSNSENDRLRKELSKNYINECDDLVDDLDDKDSINNDFTMDAAKKDCTESRIVEKTGPSARTTTKRNLHVPTDVNESKTVRQLWKENKALRNELQRVEKEKQDQMRSFKKDFNEQLVSENHVVLESLMSAAQRNIYRLRCGYRQDDIIKAFAGYMKMIGGTLAYETLYANLSLCWPSRSTINKFIKDNKPAIVEGKLRKLELLNYLKERNLPLRVSLSGDATRIISTVSYDHATNQLVGFPLPLDEKGMPIAYSYMARNVKEIKEHYESNVTSSNVYVQMAQPISRSVPPFCLITFLTDNRFTAETGSQPMEFHDTQTSKFGHKSGQFRIGWRPSSN